MDAIRYGLQQVFEDLPHCAPVGLVDQLGERERAGTVNVDEQVELAFGAVCTSAISMWKKPMG